ncbi:MAG: histidine kinase [Saprospiraceae bacterium]|nr:histidine kinase [Lewinella sp.]
MIIRKHLLLATLIRNRSLTFLIFALTLSAIRLPAQITEQPYFRNYSTNDGLPSSEVHDIIQDQRGYLWIATDNGVSRFDGYKFKNYGAKQGLKNNVVFHLQEDHEGRIWMQTLSGNLYYYLQDSIYTYPFNDTITKYQNYYLLPNDFIIHKDGTVYCSLYGIGVLKIAPSGKHEFINARTNIGLLFYRSPEKQRYLFSASFFRSRKHLGSPPPHLNNTKAVLILKDQAVDSIFIPDTKGGNLIRNSYADDDMVLFEVHEDQALYRTQEQLSFIDLPARIAEITRLDKALWIGFNDKMGVHYYSDLEAIPGDNYRTLLFGKSISAVCPDQNGGYWFGSLNEGIFYAPSLTLKVFRREGIPANNNILSLAAGPDRTLLYGTVQGGVYALDQQRRSVLLHQDKGPVFDLWYQADKGKLWIAGNRLRIVEGSDILLPGYAPSLKLPNPIFYKRMFPYPEQNLLIGNSGFGLEKLDIDREEVFFTMLNAPNRERVICTIIDFSGRIWVGNTKGLFQFKDASFLPPPFTHPSFEIRVEAIAQLRDSTLVFGTKGRGVALWKNDTVTVIDESDGLTTNMIENIYIDSLQQIWVGTLNGLNKINRVPGKDTWEVRRITISHGLPSDEINDLCQVGEWMYVATAGGIAQLPLLDTLKAPPATVYWESTLVNGFRIDPEELQHLNASQKNIQLQYVSINFRFAGDILYRYRINPDIEWSLTEERSVNYAALAPGKYLFEVQAQNEDGIWSESLQISINIAYPFWQQWWFLLMAVAASFALLYFLYRRRFDRLRKEAAIEREISELQRSALQAQMNPHFIFNCLNSIQNFIASGDKQNAMQYLSRFATLVRTTLNASVQNTITLEEELLVIKNYLELEKLRFGNKFEYEIQVDPQIDQFDISIPPLLVQPFVENAIQHGFNFEDRSKIGNILITYAEENGMLRITVRDNGIGIKRSQLAKSEQEQLRASLGMSITKKRLAALQQQHSERPHLQVHEIIPENGTDGGTEIIIRIDL